MKLLKAIISWTLFVFFLFSCTNIGKKHTDSNGQETKTATNASANDEITRKLDGEWIVMYSWADTVLIFKNKRDKNYSQEIFPSYNTIIFETKTHIVDVKTYGEFGCGTAATQNLRMDTKWTVANELLHLKGEYSDYSGQHTLDNFYNIYRKGQTLKLIKIK